MVSQSSQRTLAQPTRPADPARSFNERSHGIMRKMHALTAALSEFGVDIALLIRTPRVEFTYESKDDMLRNFNSNLPEENRFRPQDVENLFRGRVLVCPSINSMSLLRSHSGSSSPTPSTSSASSAPLPDATGLSFPASPPTHPAGPGTTIPSASPISEPLPPAAETGLTLPASPSPSQGVSLSYNSSGSSPTLMSDSPPPTSPAMDISNLLNTDCWTVDSDVPFSWPPVQENTVQDKTAYRPLPSSPPIRPTTPTPSTSGSPHRQARYRVLKVSPRPQSRRKWIA
ncbi:hypothetical protein VTI28DRAFT_271 [Corynascus sepedonium]